MDDTKRVFAEALQRLQRERRGAKITVTDIAEEAGFDRHTFYYHFSSLFDLLSWMFEDEIDRLSRLAGSDWAGMIAGILEYSEAERDFVLSLFHSEYKEKIRSFLSDEMKERASVFIRERFAVPEPYIQCVSEFLACGMLGLYFSWLDSGMEKTSEEVFQEFEFIISHVLNGFSAK